MCDQRYNGWTNRETWLINLWFSPETEDDVDSIKEYFEKEYNKLPDFMKDFVYDTSINWDELREEARLNEKENEE